MWSGNCVTIRLSAGFLEPLESTGLYLIMRAILNFAKLLPNRTPCPYTRAEFNRLMDIEYENIRDFIVLHYCTSQRTDSPFWRDWQAREIPDSLKTKLGLYKNQGRLIHNDVGLFAQDSWHAVLTGMGVLPRD
jgi:tryptophan halogenase